MNRCQNEERFFSSGCFPYWPCEPILLEEDPWGGTAAVDLATVCSSLLLQHMEKSGGCRCHCFFTSTLPACQRLLGPPSLWLEQPRELLGTRPFASVCSTWPSQSMKLKPLPSTSTTVKHWQFIWKHGSQLSFSNCHAWDCACVELSIFNLMNCETGPSSVQGYSPKQAQSINVCLDSYVLFPMCSRGFVAA